MTLHEVADGDRADQQTPVEHGTAAADDLETPTAVSEIDLEADPVDVAEQRRTAPLDDPYRR